MAKMSSGSRTRSSARSGGSKTKARSGAKGRSSSAKGRSSASKGRGGKRKASSKRQLINTGSDKRFVRRGAAGQFKESDDVGRSLSSDRRKKAKTVSKPGQGDRGDRKRS